jgi:hypothetical protein
MQDATWVRSRKQRSTRAVVAGMGLMALALLVSARDLAPMMVTTVMGIAGFILMTYGVNVGWLVFYDKEPDGPPT